MSFYIYTIYKYGYFLLRNFNSFLDIVTVTELISNTDFLYFLKFWQSRQAITNFFYFLPKKQNQKKNLELFKVKFKTSKLIGK